jgi:hypothetical protein
VEPEKKDNAKPEEVDITERMSREIFDKFRGLMPTSPGVNGALRELAEYHLESGG